ncbi:MAG: hypothetical protein H6582_11525 [Crocinitomicaceae bacterium]|nr:hypothetical protein [Crocinitomicaceae bacterium]
MKALTLLLGTLLTLSVAASTINFVDIYRPERGLFRAFKVPMVFDSDSVTCKKPAGMKIGEIYRIDYIATSPNNKLSDYQKWLNRKRWVTLNAFLGIDPEMEFEKHAYYQTKAQNEEEAKKLFHGFVVYFREPAEFVHKSSVSSTSSLMETICGRKITDKTTDIYIPKSTRLDSVYVGSLSERDRLEWDKRLTKGRSVVVEWGYDSIGVDKKYHNAYYIITKVAPGIATAFAQLADKSLFDMFKRNNINENTLIVTDMTGSMYPYYSQLLVWHAFKMSQGKKMNHVFFNDGDTRPDKEKVVGETGGIYYSRSTQLLDVYQSMNKCMKGGFGGDCPENNFEAIEAGLKKYPKTTNVLMLCDNWAVPRDTVLIHGIQKPITFIMCGAEMGVNPRYVDLACQNGGTIMTVENSISGLKELKKGEEIKIGKKTYRKGRFRFERTGW